MATTFPSELLFHVFEYAAPPDCRTLRTVSRGFSKVATRFAFRALQTTNTLESSTNILQLLSDSSLSKYVEEIEYEDRYLQVSRRMPRRKVSHLTLHDIKLVHNAIVAWVSLLRTLPVLQSLSMRFPSGLPDFELQHAVLEALKASPNSVTCPLPALRNLSLQNVHHGHPSPFVDVLSCANPYPHLTHLFLSTPPCFYTPSKVTEFWMQGVLPVLRCCSATLTALTLKSVEEIGFPTVVFDGIYFPHLTNLSLARVLFDEKTGTEGFILRHAPTLSFLELIGCKAVMITDMPTPGPSYTWEKIYKSFALDLQSLSILVISPDTMHDSDDEDAAVVQDITYTQRSAVEEWNMHHFDDYRPPPWLEADAVALAELSKSVSQRWERSIQE